MRGSDGLSHGDLSGPWSDYPIVWATELATVARQRAFTKHFADATTIEL